MERLIVACIAGFFGLLFGSFLNVCVYRLPLDLSVVLPRSFCPSCEHHIAAFDNIPLLSFIFLGGKCRYCHAPIPFRYPLVELLTGAFTFLGYFTYGATLPAFVFALFCAIQIALLFTDLESRILPDEFTLGGVAAGLILAYFSPLQSSLAYIFLGVNADKNLASLLESALGAAFPSFFLWGFGELFRRIRGHEGLGFGDVKMLAMIGAFLGLPAAFSTALVGFTLGSVVGMAFVVFAKKEASSYALPLGTFLGIAALFVATSTGPARILHWFHY